MRINKVLPMVMVEILVCSGPMVGIHERVRYVLSIIVPHALLSRGVKLIAFVMCICIEWLR